MAALFYWSVLPQQVGQLGDIRRDPPRLVADEELGPRIGALKQLLVSETQDYFF